MEPMWLVRTTLPREAEALQLARAVIEGRHAACAHVLPMRSAYRWQGRLEEEPEWLVEARALPGQVDAVADRMRQGHPYELPLIEVQEVRVSAPYAEWARRESGPQG